jgi:hypothetical protein
MTLPILVILAAVLALGLWIRVRLAAARRQLEELEAFRAELGIPHGRFRVVDVGLGESLSRVLRPWSKPPRFADVHRTRPVAEHCADQPVRPSQNAVARALGLPRTTVQRAIAAHRPEWDALATHHLDDDGEVWAQLSRTESVSSAAGNGHRSQGDAR